MLTILKNLFSKDEDPNLTSLKKLFNNDWKMLDDVEQAIVMLRLSGLPKADVAIALSLSSAKLEAIEQNIIKRLKK